MGERLKSRTGLVMVTFVLIMISSFFIAGTVKGQVRNAVREDDGYYKRLESDYLAQIRSILEEEGYADSGLTLTFSREGRGARTYLLKIHNRRFEKMDDFEKQEILKLIGRAELGVPDCRIYQEFCS